MNDKTSQVRFSPSSGLVVGQTVKEQVYALLAEGYFDDADSAIFGVSSKTAYDTRWAGSRFDCFALVQALGAHLARDK